MDQEKTQQFKKALEVKKVAIEKQLEGFAKKDSKLKGDYDTKFPDFGAEQSIDESALEVAEYEASLSIEHTLELGLRDINEALERIDQGTYGMCGNCHQEIDIKRLEIFPEAKTCIKCKK